MALLVVDVGNTQTVIGVYDGEILSYDWRIATDKNSTADEIKAKLSALFFSDGFEASSVDGAALSSVVPRLSAAWCRAVADMFGTEMLVCSAAAAGDLLEISYPRPDEIGADRIADSVAAKHLYGAPVILVDFGTATNMEVIDKEGRFIGGIIAPGVETSAQALFSRASRLADTALVAPPQVVGTCTTEALQSGIVLGEADRVDGLIRRVFAQLGYKAPVVATGGLATVIAQHSSEITETNPTLTLEGLRLIFQRRNVPIPLQSPKACYSWKRRTSMLTDIEIAQAATPQNIREVAQTAGVPEKYLECYGNYKAKVDYNLLREEQHQDGKLVLVTAINPTPAGEGKTTTTVGLADALRKRGQNCVVALREPSLGPVFGIKGGAAGGGYAQVIPMEDINLHFTGDFHAIGAANNLLAALLDAHIHNGNELNIDVRKITWKRVVDMNDRQLRYITDGLGGKANGVPREDGFDITVASEVMAIFCLATSITDLKERLGRIVVGYTFDDKPVTAHDLHAEGAMTALLKDALKPNLVQTLEGTPAFVHGGPFANIAHGCNSIMATRMAMALGDIAVTEAGFGADLGAEKFLDIKCRLCGLKPDAVVVVATVRALKNHGGVAKADLNTENLEALEAGLPNLLQHVENITKVYNLPCVVAINAFPTDTKAELDLVEAKCKELGVNVALSEVWAKGGEGGLALADEVMRLVQNGDEEGRSADTFEFSYEADKSLKEKITAIAQRVYHADGVIFDPKVSKEIAKLESLGFGDMPVCMAKTQYSFSDDQTKLGAPKDFSITVRDIKVSAGAGFVVALTGSIMTMPGLGKSPAAFKIDVDETGKISGLF